MSPTMTGWMLLIAALGMMLGLISDDISHLSSWAAVQTPGFVGTMLGHLAAVIAAFVGGKIMPVRTK